MSKHGKDNFPKDENGDDVIFDEYRACHFCGGEANIAIFSLRQDDEAFLYFCNNVCFCEYCKRLDNDKGRV